MRVSVIVVTCGRPALLARCLAAVTTHATRHDLYLITVHAPSDDEAVEMVRTRFPGVHVLTARERGVALQRNAGMRAAAGDVLLFLDDDAWPDTGCIDALLRAFEDDDGVAAAGGPVLDADGSLQMGPRAISRFARTRPVRGPDAVPRGYVFQVTGCNMALRAGPLRAIGGFDERYAYHLDDSDVAVRLHDAGRRIAWVPGARVFHEKAPGPHRVTIYDRDWRSVAMNDVVFAFRHVRGARPRLAVVPWCLQAGRALRCFAWLLRGRISPALLLRCWGQLLGGTVAGYRRGLGER